MTRGPEYPVARMPGGVAAGLDDVRTERRAVLEEVASQQQSEEAEVSGPAGGGADAAVRQQRGYTQANPLDLRSLRFIAKLGRCVFLGRYAASRSQSRKELHPRVSRNRQTCSVERWTQC